MKPLLCPRCLQEGTIDVRLDDGDTLTCRECEEEYSVDAVIAMIESWSQVLPWLLAHPARKEGRQC